MSVKRLPIPVLRPFVTLVWDSDQAASSGQPLREHLLPSGAMHLVFRLTDCQLCIFDAPDTPQPQRIGGSIIGGIQSRFYIRESFGPSRSVGAVLRPGTAELLFGATAEELAEKHTPLESLWGGAAQYLRERLLETENAAERLTVLETSLAARLPRARCLHPAIATVIDAMQSLQSVEAAVQRSGISHRQFISHFRRTVGLTPKTYLRVQRFQRALQALRQREAVSLAALAAEAGYSDQAHFNRDFLIFAGVVPTVYQRLSPYESNHVPIANDRAAILDVNL
jgi:AraC-like DNA-binding protein